MPQTIAGSQVVFGSARRIIEEFTSRENFSSIHVLCDHNTYKHCWPVLEGAGWSQKPFIVTIAPGEGEKTLITCRHVWNALVDNNADRKSLFISLGGGVITDLGGFCASTFMRGMRFIHVPTSLMGMTDAAIGGKHGIDLGKLKNYLGVFSSPEAIIIDNTFLETLPEREFRNGMAEVVKHAVLGNPQLLDEIERLPKEERDKIADVIHTSVMVKKSFVDGDELDKGKRAALNFGHTIGHAMESAVMKTREALLHGEAIGLGMLVEGRISVEAAGLPERDYTRLKEVVFKVFPELQFPDIDLVEMKGFMLKDKKKYGSDVQFALLTSLGNPVTGQVVPDSVIDSAWQYVKSF